MFKKLASYYKKHKGLLIFDIICTLLFAGIDTIYPYLTREILDGKASTVEKLAVISGALLLVYILHYFCSYAIGYFGHVLGIKIETDMRADLFKKIESLDYQYFDDKQSGELLANLTAHLNEISEASHHSVEDFITVAIHLFVPLVLCTIVNWKLALVMVAGLACLAIFTAFKRKIMMNCFRSVRKEQGELSAKLASSLSGVQLTKAFNNENFEVKNFSSINDEYRLSKLRQVKQTSVFYSTNNFIANITKLILLAVAGYIIIQDNGASISDFVMFFLYTNSLIAAVSRFPQVVETTQQAWSGYEKFYSIMTFENKIVSPPDAVSADNIEGKIEFNDVSFSYKNDGNNVLNGFSLVINPGEKIGVVGETGVGKSTISKLIPRFYDVTGGELTIDGINIKDFDIASIRNQIGHIQQDVFIFWGSVADNIRYGKPEASMDDIIEAAKKARIDDFIETLPQKYDTLCGERGILLSGGQKQRIAIARIFLRNPKILILDEATSALDNITEKMIQKSFDELSSGKTSIIIAHRLTTVKNCDKIVVLGKDGISECGTHDELMELDGYYAKMYNASLEE